MWQGFYNPICIWANKFFRLRLLTLSNEEIVELLEGFDKDAKAIKKDLLTMCWFMRGSISFDDANLLSYEDRKFISELIKSNLETTKESGLPFF